MRALQRLPAYLQNGYKKVGDYECISCGECKEACKLGAIRFGWEKNNHKKDNG